MSQTCSVKWPQIWDGKLASHTSTLRSLVSSSLRSPTCLRVCIPIVEHTSLLDLQSYCGAYLPIGSAFLLWSLLDLQSYCGAYLPIGSAFLLWSLLPYWICIPIVKPGFLLDLSIGPIGSAFLLWSILDLHSCCGAYLHLEVGVLNCGH